MPNWFSVLTVMTDEVAQPPDGESRVSAESAVDDGSPVSTRQADFLQMRQLPLEMFPDPVLPADGLLRGVRR